MKKNIKSRYNFYYLFCIFTLININVYSQFPSFKTFYKGSYVLTESDKNILSTAYPKFEAIHIMDSGYAYNIQNDAGKERDKIDALINLCRAPTVKVNPDSLLALNKYYKRRDELTACINLMGSINRLTGTPKIGNRIFPIHNAGDSHFFYEGLQDGGLSVGNSITLQGNGDRGVVNTDLIAGYVSVFRISFNTVFLASKDSTTNLNTVEKVFNGGGTTTINVSYPWLYYQNQTILFVSQFSPKFVGDFPVFGNDIAREDFVGYMDIGNELYLQINEKSNKFKFFGNFKLARIYGTTSFYRNLESVGDHGFWIGQVYAGVNIADRFAIGVNIPLLATNNISHPKNLSIGFTIFPDFSKKNAPK